MNMQKWKKEGQKQSAERPASTIIKKKKKHKIIHQPHNREKAGQKFT